MQLSKKIKRNDTIDLLKYTPECLQHGFMRQTKTHLNTYKWKCIESKCNETKFGLSSHKLLEAIVDSQFLDMNEIDKADFEKALIYFMQISSVEYSLLINVLFEQKINISDNWIINLSEIQRHIEKRIRTELNEKLMQAKIERSLVERAKKNFRICLLCGLSSCMKINNCMVTSD